MSMTRKPSLTNGSRAMPGSIKGLNKVKAKLADGTEPTYWYHRASGTRLKGEYGSPEFVASLAEAQAKKSDRTAGTLAGLIRDFERTAKWRKLRDSTKAEYRRMFTFWDGKFGTVPLKALEAKGFRQRVLAWHDEFSATSPREADNRVTILARVLSWGAKDGPLSANVLDGFDRAYENDRSDKIWLPEHIEAMMAVSRPEMQLALVLALHTGQRQGDILKMAWGNYDGARVTLRQNKGKRLVSVPCTAALKITLDGLRRRSTLILPTASGVPYKARHFGRQWADAYKKAGLEYAEDGKPVLHFHDLRGTAVTMLFEAGCTVAEVAAITGHSLRTAQEILDRYLARTSTLATSAIAKFENRMEQERAKRSAK